MYDVTPRDSSIQLDTQLVWCKKAKGNSECVEYEKDVQGATGKIFHTAKLFDFKQQVCINPSTDGTQVMGLSHYSI